MTTQTPPSAPDMAQLRAELRTITDEKSLLDDIEGNLEGARAKEDEEIARKRKREDSDLVRRRAGSDKRREARQGELWEREAVRIQVER